MKKMKYIVIAITIIILALLLRGFYTDSKIDKEKEDAEPIKREQQLAPELINSSDIYFNGSWEMNYTDIVHYANDEKGQPKFDLYKLPETYTFNQVGESLILEEEYPIIENQYEGKRFSLKVDLKIIYLNIEGQLVDKENWIGTLEYVGEGNQLLSKCSVKAKRL